MRNGVYLSFIRVEDLINSVKQSNVFDNGKSDSWRAVRRKGQTE